MFQFEAASDALTRSVCSKQDQWGCRPVGRALPGAKIGRQFRPGWFRVADRHCLHVPEVAQDQPTAPKDTAYSAGETGTRRSIPCKAVLVTDSNGRPRAVSASATAIHGCTLTFAESGNRSRHSTPAAANSTLVSPASSCVIARSRSLEPKPARDGGLTLGPPRSRQCKATSAGFPAATRSQLTSI